MQLGWWKCHSITFLPVHKGGREGSCLERMREGGNKWCVKGGITASVLLPMNCKLRITQKREIRVIQIIKFSQIAKFKCREICAHQNREINIVHDG